MTKPTDPAALSSPAPADPDDQGQGEPLTRELRRVEEANLAFYEAFTRLDMSAMARCWSKSPHARCVHPGWELVVGWNDIRQSWTDIFRTVKAVEFQLEDVHAEVAGRTAWVNLVGYVEITTDEDETFQASVVTTNIFEKLDGEWLLTLHHSSNFAEEEDLEDDDEDEDDDELEFEGARPGGANEPN
jgi:ketosteroid isomerase-like protein